MNLSPSGHPVIIAMPLAPLALSMLAAMASRGLLGGAMPLAPPIASPSVSPSASPSVSPSGSPIPSPSGSPTPSPSGSPTPSPTIVSSPPPSPVPSGSPTKHAKKPKVTARAPAGSVAVDRFSLTSRFAALAGLTYDGIAAVPTAQGPQRMLKFTMRSLRLPGMVLTVTQGGHSFVTADSSMRFIGDVQLYTTKLTGVIAGIRVTFTSANPPKSLPANLTLTDVTAEQPFATADVLQAAQSQVSAG